MRVRTILIAMMAFCLGGCAIFKTENVQKIALLAPFEGQYRDIGYEALYAARLALEDSGSGTIELLAIDDGGRLETAILRGEAIQLDPAIEGVILLGSYASDPDVQLALGDLPVVVAGHWNTYPASDHTIVLSNAAIDDMVTFDGSLFQLDMIDTTITGSELLSLEQVPLLTENPELIEIVSSASLPDVDFRERYLNSDQFVPEPRLIAPLAYDATQLLLEAIKTGSVWDNLVYQGITGTFRFENGYWQDAPINHFGYDAGSLVEVRPSTTP